ncbi:MAG: 30S ribosomal protein S6 [Ruminococcaceae bacterium]|nr:30S ribosomal protein S6 [Oscillospiraceae bacterium]
MAKTISSYETIFVVDLQLGDEGVAAVIEKFKALIAENGTISEVNEWGKRRLAYPINDQNDGYYVYVTFTAAPDFPAELNRVYHITEGILRSVVVSK